MVRVLRARQDTGKAQDRMRLAPQTAGYWSRAKYPYFPRAGVRGDGGTSFDELLDRAGG